MGWRCVCAVEIEDYPRRILLARQQDGTWPRFPVWDDITTFDGRPWRGRVDVVSGGFPCQDISTAGKGEGIEGSRSGLWSEMARIVGEVQPSFVFVENSPALTLRGLDRVLADLATLGYDAPWGVLGAVDAGAPHRRKRIWIMANAECFRRRESTSESDEERKSLCAAEREEGPPGPRSSCQDVANTNRIQRRPRARGQDREKADDGNWWRAEPELGRVADGVADRLDRLAALGEGQVPAVARLAWETLKAE